jgi:hypothetical protein
MIERCGVGFNPLVDVVVAQSWDPPCKHSDLELVDAPNTVLDSITVIWDLQDFLDTLQLDTCVQNFSESSRTTSRSPVKSLGYRHPYRRAIKATQCEARLTTTVLA